VLVIDTPFHKKRLYRFWQERGSYFEILRRLVVEKWCPMWQTGYKQQRRKSHVYDKIQERENTEGLSEQVQEFVHFVKEY